MRCVPGWTRYSSCGAPPAARIWKENFAPVRAYYKALLDCLGWKDAGIVYAGGNMAAGDIQAHPEQLEAARQLGAAL